MTGRFKGYSVVNLVLTVQHVLTRGISRTLYTCVYVLLIRCLLRSFVVTYLHLLRWIATNYGWCFQRLNNTRYYATYTFPVSYVWWCVVASYLVVLCRFCVSYAHRTCFIPVCICSLMDLWCFHLYSVRAHAADVVRDLKITFIWYDSAGISILRVYLVRIAVTFQRFRTDNEHGARCARVVTRSNQGTCVIRQKKNAMPTFCTI